MSNLKYLPASIVEKTFDTKTVAETRKMKFIISTGSKDRGREVVNMDNWQLETYKSNPIVGYQHSIYGGSLFSDPNPDFVIGKSEVGIDTFDGKKIIEAEATFEPESINPMAEKIFQKLMFGSLNAASVGILPIGDGRIDKKEKTYYYDGQELLEWSIVNIPMNQDARRMSVKSLAQQYAEEFFNNVPLDEKMKQTILDAIEKQYGLACVDEAEKELHGNKGTLPNLDKYKERFEQIKKEKK